MDERLTPFCLMWDAPATSIFVSGSFNNFSFTFVEPEKRVLVVWAKPGRLHYHFLVDGSVEVIKSSPSELVGGLEYNYSDIVPLPEELGDIAMLTPSELEILDNELFNADVEDQDAMVYALEDEISDESSHQSPLPSLKLPTCIGDRRSLHSVLVIQRRTRRFLTELRLKRRRQPRRVTTAETTNKCKARLPKVMLVV